MLHNKKIFTIFLTLSAFVQAEFMILDQGHTVISGPVADVMITHCDVFQKLSLEGKIIPLDHIINRLIIEQEVKVDKMPLDDSAADKYIANIQKVHNLSTEDLENLADQCNKTLLEVKQELSSQYTYDFFLYHKFRAHLVPTDQAVEEYCKEHPETESGYCTIQVAFVEYTKEKKAEVKAKIDAMIADKIVDNSMVSWSDSIKVDMDNIADDKLFIKAMEVGEISIVDDKSVFELYKLLEKVEEHEVPVEKRKAFVIDVLNRQMYEGLLATYEEHMRDNVAIINLAPAA